MGLINSEFLNIITTTSDLMNVTRVFPLALSGCIMRLCTTTTNKTTTEMLKIVREKLVRSQLKRFVFSFVQSLNAEKGECPTKIFVEFYHFLRMLESVLDKSDLRPIFADDDAPFKSTFSNTGGWL